MNPNARPLQRTALDLASRLAQDETGASHLEYALIAFFAGTSLIGGILVLTGGLQTFYNGAAVILANLL
jgi:Flp pilus assembly pilin Flp